MLTDIENKDTVVPGQIIYVDSNYAVRASGPNSGSQEAEGGKLNSTISSGFKYTPGTEYGKWDYQADGIDGFLACPYNNGIYQVFVNSPNTQPPRGQKLDACLPFTAGAFEYDLPGNVTAAAWQY